MNELENKIKQVVNKIDNDDSRLLKAMYEYINQDFELSCPKKVVDSLETLKGDNSIVLDVDNIDFDAIWNTEMRIKLDFIMDSILNCEVTKIDEKFLHKLLLTANDVKVLIKRPEDRRDTNKKIENIDNRKVDLDDLIKDFSNVGNLEKLEVFYKCNEVNNKNVFFINEFEKFLMVLKNPKLKNKLVYDLVCEEISNNFLKFNFCDFRNNKCISQRHKNLFFNNYPVPGTDGCCFKSISKCKHNNKDGTCKVKCISCRLFICPYLRKRGVGYNASDFLLIRAFYNVKQRRTCVYSFFQDEENILKKIEKSTKSNK